MLWKLHIYFAVITQWLLHRSTYGVLLVIVSNTFASDTIMPFLPVPCLRYARSYLPWKLSSGFEYRCYQHNVSAFRSTCFICCYSHLYLPCPKSFSCCGHTRSLGEKDVLAILLVAFFSLVGVIIWVTSKEITRSSWRLCFSMYISDSSVASQCRSYLFPPNATPVLLFRINRLWTHY